MRRASKCRGQGSVWARLRIMWLVLTAELGKRCLGEVEVKLCVPFGQK